MNKSISLNHFENLRDYITPFSIKASGKGRNQIHFCGITLPLKPFFIKERNDTFNPLSFINSDILRDYTTFLSYNKAHSESRKSNYCGITLPFYPIDPINSLIRILNGDRYSPCRTRDYTASSNDTHNNQSKKESENCGITLPFRSSKRPERYIQSSSFSFRSLDILRDYTTNLYNLHKLNQKVMLISCGITLPITGSYYLKLRVYTILFWQFLSDKIAINSKYCGITLPFNLLKSLTIKPLIINSDNENGFEKRDYTTFCGITLLCLGLHYLKFRYYTILFAELHLLFIRCYTTIKKGIKTSKRAYFKGFKFFFSGPIKLPNKTLLNYYIKVYKDFTTVQFIKQCLHTQTHLFAPKRKRA